MYRLPGSTEGAHPCAILLTYLLALAIFLYPDISHPVIFISKATYYDFVIYITVNNVSTTYVIEHFLKEYYSSVDRVTVLAYASIKE
jgi:hypothetical protein